MARAPTPAETTRLLDAGGTRATSLLIVAQGGPQVVPLTEGAEVLIGRAATAKLVIDDPSLSRHHAVFRLKNGDVEVEDLESANGTVVGADRLRPRTPARVPIGTTVHLGEVIVVVQIRSGTVADRLRPQAAAPSEELVARIAASSISVLILGETGVGKEVMAERLHALSARRDRPLIKLNCAALMSSVLESELFGYERGAFTGAVKDKPGLIEIADTGTLFLDEIGEADPSVQVKLLRVLEARETQRIGALRPRVIDVRFVAATNRVPAEQIQAGTLRQDLYYRLAGFTITIPPLRDRRDQIPALAHELLRRNGGALALTSDAIARLRGHDWPGNVRELGNVLARAAVIGNGPTLRAVDIDEALKLEPVQDQAPSPPRPKTSAAVAAASTDPEQARVLAVLEECGGNQSMAAERLGMSRRSLVYRLQSWGLTRPRRR